MYVIVYILIVLYILVQGADNFESIAGISKCDGPYWGVFVALMVSCISLTFLTSWILLRRTKQYDEAGYDWYH